MDLNKETNNRLKSLQLFVGKSIPNSPSGFMNWLKPVVISAEEGSLTFSYKIRNDMVNPYGILHGGVTAGIIDDLIGATVYTLNLKNTYTTINNYIDYFASAKEGDEVLANTNILKRGDKIINVKCEVFMPKTNKTLAIGYSNMLKI